MVVSHAACSAQSFDGLLLLLFLYVQESLEFSVLLIWLLLGSSVGGVGGITLRREDLELIFDLEGTRLVIRFSIVIIIVLFFLLILFVFLVDVFHLLAEGLDCILDLLHLL